MDGYRRRKGQIVIPKQARDIFDIKPGDTLVLLGDEKRELLFLPRVPSANLRQQFLKHKRRKNNGNCGNQTPEKGLSTFTLTDVSFDLNAGRITGFIGRNGAGKTTTIKVMLGLAHSDLGQVSYFGIPFEENENEIKQRIGYSTGVINYYPKKKIKDIVAVTKSFYTNWDEPAYREYLTMFSLDENKTPSELSEGMKVKFNLLLAMSLIGLKSLFWTNRQAGSIHFHETNCLIYSQNLRIAALPYSFQPISLRTLKNVLMILCIFKRKINSRLLKG